MAEFGDVIAAGRPTLPFGARLKRRFLDPAVLAGPPTAAFLCLLRWQHLTAPLPYWLLVVVVLVAQVVSNMATAAWDHPEGWQLTAYVGVVMCVIAAVAYATGWGPVLSLGFIFGAAYVLQLSGSRATVPSIVWAVVFMSLGQLWIALGDSPSLIKPPLVHGLAGLSLFGVVLTIILLGYFTRQREVTDSRLVHSERRFKALVRNASDIIIVTDADGVPSYVSPAFQRTLGFDAAELDGHPASALMHPDDLVTMRSEAPEREEFVTDQWTTELRLHDSDGTWRWFEASVSNRLADPDVAGIVANLREITERKEAEKKLHQAHERFRSSFENAPIGMAVTDLEGNIMRTNAAYGRILGRSADDLVGGNVHQLTHPDDHYESVRAMERHRLDDSESYLVETRYLRPDGSTVWASVNVSCIRDSDGQPMYFIAQIEDITERRTHREQLAHAALHDPLTGLPNRTLFMDRLQTAIARSMRHSEQVAVFFLDLDRFKRINDSLGHDGGDQLLQAVAERLNGAIRPADTVARFGGDEFTVLCEDIPDEAAALDLAQRIIASLDPPVSVAGMELFVTASIGVALGRHPMTPERLVREADTAMYRAKEKGRASVEVFADRDDLWSVSRLQMGNDLHRALKNDEFELHYQPFVELHDTTVVGIEALIRWRHPDRGLIPPGEFIQLADDIGLIAPLGRWVLQEACAQAARWRTHADRKGSDPWRQGISVNVSPRQLADRTFASQVASVLDDTGLDPDALWLEITESTLLRDPDSAIATLRAIRDQGVHLSVDDFGTGYSSLSYLQQLPVECLKIDHSFVERLDSSHEATAITKAIIALADSLGLVCIAEGIETPSQVERVRALGCVLAQGYLFGEPLPASSLGEAPASHVSSWTEVRLESA